MGRGPASPGNVTRQPSGMGTGGGSGLAGGYSLAGARSVITMIRDAYGSSATGSVTPPWPETCPGAVKTSPVIGFVAAFALLVALFWIFRHAARRPLALRFRRLQLLSAGFVAFSHGSNDAQKTMGIITLALFSAGVIDSVEVPDWVIVISATAISLGTAAGGWRIMATMGHRVVELEPIHGFAAETTGATVIFGAAQLGMPVSTTHVISSAIMGVGSSKGTRGVKWGVARTIVMAWIVTLPVTMLVGAAVWFVLDMLNLF